MTNYKAYIGQCVQGYYYVPLKREPQTQEWDRYSYV